MDKKSDEIINRIDAIKSKKRDSKKRAKYIITKNFVLILLILWSLICLFPFFWAIIASFNPYSWFNIAGLNPIPRDEWTLDNYRTAFTYGPIQDYAFIWFFNSIVYSLAIAFLNSTLNTLAGFALARLKIKGKKLLISYFLFVILIPGMVSMMPIFMIYVKIGLISGKIGPQMFLLGLIIVSSTSVGGAVYGRQLFLKISYEQEEASYLAGNSKLKTFFKVSLRKIFPIWITGLVSGFMSGWSSFFIWVLYSAGDMAKMNLNAGITQLGRTMVNKQRGYAAMLALSNVSMVPMIILYFLTIRSHVKKVRKARV